MATWSPLTNKVRESKDNSGNRKYKVTRITPHCWVGQVSIENGLEYFATTSRQVSSNYIIGSDGRVGGCVREEWRAWTSSSRDNDNRAITIECASDAKSPYAFKSAVYSKLILLCADICKRYGKKKLLWISDKNKALSYSPKDDEMLLTVHRWFASTDCPGSWLMGRMNDLANQVTALLQGSTPTTDTYTVCTSGSALRLRAEPNTSSKQVGYINNGTTFKADKVVKGQSVGGVDTWVYYKCGYASGKYLSPTPVCPAPAPTPTPTPTPPTPTPTPTPPTPTPTPTPPTPTPTPTPPTPTPTPTGKKYICTAKSGVNIRAGAGVTYKKVGAVNYGQTVTIYTQKNGWGNMTTSGNRWVCMKYFKAK